MQRITPFLWFDGRAEEAATFYVSVFKDAKIIQVSRYCDEGQDIHGQTSGTVMTVVFELAGQQFIALNGGPRFTFNEAVSFVVNCETQEEVDYFWERLGEGGDPKAQQCGWLKDRFGLSWQVVPTAVGRMMSDPDPERSRRVMRAVLQMKKINIGDLERAYQGAA